MSKTRIVIIHLKEIIYTAIFVGLGILLILLLIFMFMQNDGDEASSKDTAEYKPGVYTTQMTLNNTTLNLEVVVDENNINSVRFVNLEDSITTMYPLIQPALDNIAKQLYNGVLVKDIKISGDTKYTQTLILSTIEETLKKAAK